MVEQILQKCIMHTTTQNSPEIQNAKNAILDLASDIGAIVSIIANAEFGGHIAELVVSINKAINANAGDAENGKFDLSVITTISNDVLQLSESMAKRKALNPLISDVLVTTIDTAVVDAKRAVSSVTIALNVATTSPASHVK